MTYRHFTVKQRHPVNPLKTRDSCICGYSSPWRIFGRDSGHPHMKVTVSRTDLTPVERVSVQSVQKFTDDTWFITYRCGCEVYGVGDFDRARAMRNHTTAECQKEKVR